MKRKAVFSAILFATIAICGNIHSAENEGGVNPRQLPGDYYCGYEELINDCTWVLEGSVCIADDDCKPIVVTPPGGQD